MCNRPGWLNNDDDVMKRKISWLYAVALGVGMLPAFSIHSASTMPAPANNVPVNAGTVMPGVVHAGAPVAVEEGAPSRNVRLSFAQIAPAPGSMVLRGISPDGAVEFGMRSDEVINKALLHLEYTPSPSLIPVQSQLKVYLNDELMDVLPITKERLGRKPWQMSRLTRYLLPILTGFIWNLSAITAMCAKTRPIIPFGWTWRAPVTWT